MGRMVYPFRKSLRSSSGTTRTEVGAVRSGRRTAPFLAFGEILMQDQERWMELCALAAKEQDPAKLVELTKEIIRALDEKEGRLIGSPGKNVRYAGATLKQDLKHDRREASPTAPEYPGSGRRVA
jgi:hypothetical protein